MAQRLGSLAGVDLAARAGLLGANLSANALMIPFFGSIHQISADGVTDALSSPLTPAVGSLLLDYVLLAAGFQATCTLLFRKSAKTCLT